MKLEARVSLKKQSGNALSVLDLPSNTKCELVHSSGRKGNITTNDVVVSGDANALLFNIEYQPEEGNLTIADFEDSLSIWNGDNNLEVSGIH